MPKPQQKNRTFPRKFEYANREAQPDVIKAPAPSPVRTKRDEDLAYLEEQRGEDAKRETKFTYMPTAWGNVGYSLTLSDFSDAELVNFADVNYEYLSKSVAFPGGDAKGAADAQGVLDLILPELARRHVPYGPPKQQPPMVFTPPPNDPSRERG